MYLDLQVLVTLINNGDVINELQGIVQDVRRLWDSFAFISFHRISGVSNVLADSLAKFGLSMLGSLIHLHFYL